MSQLFGVNGSAIPEIQNEVASLKEKKVNVEKEKKQQTTEWVNDAHASASSHASHRVASGEKRKAGFTRNIDERQKNVQREQTHSIQMQAYETVENPVETCTTFQAAIKRVRNCKSYITSIARWAKQSETNLAFRKHTRDFTLERGILQEFCKIPDSHTDELSYDLLFGCFDRCSVSQDSNCVIHCIFGRENACDYMICHDANARRDRLVNFIKCNVSSKRHSHVKSAVLCFQKNMGRYMESIKQHEQKVRQLRELEDKFYQCMSSSVEFSYRPAEEWRLLPLYLSSLELRFDEHSDICDIQSNIGLLCEQIDWTALTHEYVDYLSDSDTALGVPELAVLAECYGKQIVCYIENGNLSAPFVFNNAGDEIFYVLLNGDGQLEHLKPNVDKCRLEKYRDFRRERLGIELRRRKIKCPKSSSSFESVRKRIIDRFPKNDELVRLLNPSVTKVYPGLAETFASGLDLCAGNDLADMLFILEFISQLVLEHRNTEDLYLSLLLEPREYWLIDVIAALMQDKAGMIIDRILDIKLLLDEIKDINLLLLLGRKLQQWHGGSRLTEEMLIAISRNLSQNFSVSDTDYDILNSVDLTSWPIELTYLWWMHKISSSSTLQREATKDLQTECALLFVEIENEASAETAQTFFEEASRRGWTAEECIDHAHQCSSNYETLFDFRFFDTDRSADNIKLMIKKDGNTSQSVKELVDFLTFEKIPGVTDHLSNQEEIVLVADELRLTKMKGEHDIERFIRLFKLAVKLCTGDVELRSTQMSTIEILLRNRRSTLAQVSTGEGKTLIIAGVAIAKVLAGETVDVVSSSVVLAERDSSHDFPKGVKDVYNMFGITVSHICSEKENDRRQAYGCDVVYGELSLFQRDYLLTTFYGRNITGSRAQANIIIDEVDCMLLDRGNNVLYLSHDLPGIDGLESLYIFIWQKVVNTVTLAIRGEADDRSNEQMISEIKNDVLYDMFGTIDEDDLRKIDCGMTNVNCRELFNCLVRAKIIDRNGCCQSDTDVVTVDLPHHLKQYNDRVLYIVNGVRSRIRSTHIPKFLMPFVERHLDQWIVSAFRAALTMEENRDYVVEPDPTKNSLDLSAQVIIIDRDTGTDLTSSQWDNALHQFLQLKHRCKLTSQTLKAVFVSNVSFIKQYRSVYGLTGTLGSRVEREFLKSTFAVDYVTIPTARTTRLKQLRTLSTNDEGKWLDIIADEIRKIVCDDGRSMLLICESILDVAKVEHKVRNATICKCEDIITYTRAYEAFEYGGHQELPCGKVLIATNLAGRGTDIKVADELLKKGGLHVCLTYLPSSVRIEQQAFGRTARKGQNGSCRLMFCDESRVQVSTLHAIEKRKNRNTMESVRMSRLEEEYQKNICPQEQLFSQFSDKFKVVRDKCHDAKLPAAVRDIIGSSLLDLWAIWLDSVESQLADSKLEIVQQKWNREFLFYISCLDMSYLEKMHSDASCLRQCQWMVNPVRQVALAKHMMVNKHFSQAIVLLDNIVENDPYFEAPARYYRAAARGIPKLTNKEMFLTDIRRTQALYFDEISRQKSYCTAISSLPCHSGATVVGSFEEQKINIVRILETHVNATQDILGRPCLPQGLVGDSNSTTKLSCENIYDELMRKGFISAVKYNHDKKQLLSKVCHDYGVDVESIHEKLIKFTNERATVARLTSECGHWIQWRSKRNFWDLALQCGLFEAKSEIELLLIAKDIAGAGFRETVSLSDLSDDISRNMKELSELMKGGTQTLAVSGTRTTDRVFISNFHFIEKSQLETIDPKNSKKFEFVKMCRVNRKQLQKPLHVSSSTFQKWEFGKYKIPRSDWDNLWNFLIETNRITKCGEQWSLGDEDEDWKEYELYRDDVSAMLRMVFVHELTRRRIKESVDEGNEIVSIIGLPVNPHEQFVEELFDEGVLTYPLVTKLYKQSDFVDGTCQKILAEAADLGVWNRDVVDEDVQKYVSYFIDTHRSHLLGLEAPCASLVGLCDRIPRDRSSDLADNMSSELYVFELNAMDSIVVIGEQKWSTKMIAKAVIVIAFGVAQLVAGAIIELKSAGFITHVADVLMSEGVSDIMFGINALWSGNNFTWHDYARHKINSVKWSLITACVAGLASRGVKFFKYGFKTFGPGYSIGGKVASKEVINLTARQLAKQTFRAVCIKAASGVASGLVNLGIASLVEKYLRSLCNNLATKLRNELSSAEGRTELEELVMKYTLIGNKINSKLPKVCDLIDEVFQQSKWSNNGIMNFLSKIAGSVSAGLSQAHGKMIQAGGKAADAAKNFVKFLDTCLKVQQVLTYLESIIKLLKSHYSTLQTKLRNAIKQCTDVDESQLTPEEEQSARKTAQEQCRQFNGRLDHECGQVITEMTTIILQKAGQFAVEHCKNQVKTWIEDFREARNRENLANIDNDLDFADDEKRQSVRQQRLLKIMSNTKDPELFVEIVRMGVPMNAICADALAEVLSRFTREKIVIKLQAEDGSWSYSNCDFDTDARTIVIAHSDNHFGEQDMQSEGVNNCLLSAVKDQIPELAGYSENDLRQMVADEILNSEECAYRIKQGWHRAAIENGFYGGVIDKKKQQIIDEGRQRMRKAQEREMERTEQASEFYNRINAYPSNNIHYFDKQGNQRTIKAKSVDLNADSSTMSQSDVDLAEALSVLQHHPQYAKDENLEVTTNIGGESFRFLMTRARDGQTFIGFLDKTDNTRMHSYDNIVELLDGGSDDDRQERAKAMLEALRSDLSQQPLWDKMNVEQCEAARELIILTHVAEPAAPSKSDVEDMFNKPEHSRQPNKVKGGVGGADKLARSFLTKIAAGEMTFKKAFNTKDGEFIICREGGKKQLKSFVYRDTAYDEPSQSVGSHAFDMSESSES